MTTNFFIGKNIAQSTTDVLQPIALEQLYGQIKNPNSDILNALKQLKEMQRIDARIAMEAKKKLPYFIGATFKSNIRHAANFLHIDFLVLDLDNITNSSTILDEVFAKIIADETVLLAFVSPSGCGIKCVFKLDNSITSTLNYTKFYKAFAYHFAQQHQLNDFVDYSTCDVTRVCFISHHSNAHYNPNALPIITNPLNTIAAETVVANDAPIETKIKLDDDVYQQIITKLNPASYSKKPKQIFTPAELSLIEPVVEEALKTHGFLIKEIRDINYGKKIGITNGLHFAELNIYYGKKGFQVIKSTKSGTHAAFNEAACQIVQHALFYNWTSTCNHAS